MPSQNPNKASLHDLAKSPHRRVLDNLTELVVALKKWRPRTSMPPRLHGALPMQSVWWTGGGRPIFKGAKPDKL